jgi:hypothetical protein
MRTLVVFGVIVVALVAAAVLLLGKNVELLATSSVPIGAEPTIDPASTRTIAVLEKGTRVDVLSCKDLKHYLVPKVRLSDGQVGYVLGGQFELTKTMPSLAFNKPIVFSCM